ncbi:hypothetical protein [Streptomyces sp. NPDC048521]|uniref:hypothetical protein n=1 Tax=Streptomyces sp. NPDC048521 TaxID=3365566 RepID=UPI0037239375
MSRRRARRSRTVSGFSAAPWALRPWQRLGDWAADQVRFTGAWVRGGFGRQAVVVLVHAVTAPRTSWRIMRTPATETRTPTPVRDPDWVANRNRGEHE